jgi:hypothetical protein
MRKAALFWATLFLGGSAIAMAADFTGTWNANLTKSSGDIGDIVSYKLKIEEIGPKTYRTITDVAYKSGKKSHTQVDRIYDGQEQHVLINGKTSEGTDISELMGGGSRKITMKENGKVVEVLTSTVSDDGKTLINREKTDKGERVVVYEKQ